ncbi:HAMP domain-containing protein [Halovenus salina]|uniref:HAMP domain-containing protein n=1 Tax=Halovenus salina TaxID=1510225 RepID=A0ABD5W270_9EURY
MIDKQQLLDKIPAATLDLKTKLVGAFLVVAVVAALAGLIGVIAVSSVGSQADQIGESATIVDESQTLQLDVNRQERAARLLAAGDESGAQRIAEAQAAIEERVETLESYDLDAEQQEALEELVWLNSKFNRGLRMLQEAVENDNQEQIDTALESISSDGQAVREQAGTLVELAVADEAASSQQADQTQQRAMLFVGATTVLSFVVAVLVGLFVTRRITPPISQVSEASVAMSDGNLDYQVERHSADDELGRMTSAFIEMQENLRGVFTDLDAVSQNIESGDLDRRVDTDYPGTYGEIMASFEGEPQSSGRVSTRFRQSATTSRRDGSGVTSTATGPVPTATCSGLSMPGSANSKLASRRYSGRARTCGMGDWIPISTPICRASTATSLVISKLASTVWVRAFARSSRPPTGWPRQATRSPPGRPTSNARARRPQRASRRLQAAQSARTSASRRLPRR